MSANHQPPPLPNKKNRTTQIWIWTTVGIVALAIIVIALVKAVQTVTETIQEEMTSAMAGISTPGAGIPTTSDILQQQITYPLSVKEGEEFDLTLTIRNPNTTTINLESIDLLLSGFKVTGSPTDTTHDGATEWAITTPLPTGTTLSKTFKLKAETIGIWTGDIDLWHSGDSPETNTITIQVTAP